MKFVQSRSCSRFAVLFRQQPSRAMVPVVHGVAANVVDHRSRSTIGDAVPAPMTPFGFGPNRFAPG